jgi:hypothetical protein
MNSLLASRSNHDRIDSAMTPPTPGTAARSSAGAFITASSVPKCDARAVDADGPRFRMPSAVSTRGSGRVRDPSMPASSLRALIEANPSRVSSCSSVSEYRSAGSCTNPALINWPTVRSPRPSMSIAPRDAQ